MPLVLTRKLGESIKFTDDRKRSIIVQLKSFTQTNAVFQSDEDEFELNNGESLRFFGGTMKWEMREYKGFPRNTIILDFPNSVNIARLELVKCI